MTANSWLKAIYGTAVWYCCEDQ